MAKSAITPNVHQTLDVHGGLATQVTLNGEMRDLISDLFQVTVGEVFDLLGVINPTSFANFASACATNAKNSRQAHFRVLVGRNVYTLQLRQIFLTEADTFIALFSCLFTTVNPLWSTPRQGILIFQNLLSRPKQSNRSGETLFLYLALNTMRARVKS
jgi:hypothetical protein